MKLEVIKLIETFLIISALWQETSNIGTFLSKKGLKSSEYFLLKNMGLCQLFGMTPTALPGVISSTRCLQATHCTVVFCALIYSLLLAHRWKPFPDLPHQEGLELFQFFYLLLGMTEWQTALEIDSVPFARREWCLLSKEVTSGSAGLLNSSKYSYYAQRREVHLVVAMWVKEGLVLFGSFSFNQGNLIFHYLSHAAFKFVLWETEITAAWRQGNCNSRLINFGLT